MLHLHLVDDLTIELLSEIFQHCFIDFESSVIFEKFIVM